MTEIYYAEDDPGIAGRVAAYMEKKNLKVSVYGTLAELKQALTECLPTMVLLDWNMPDGRGDGLCRWIRRNWKELPIIFLTVRGDSSDMVSGFECGADDYVVKPFVLEVLYSRVQALLRRSRNVSGQYLSCGEITMDLKRMLVTCGSDEVPLSTVEYQVLLCLMRNKGRVVTREKLLEQVWDVNGNYVNDNTLSVTVKRLREKLHQPACLKTVRSVGYRMEELL